MYLTMSGGRVNEPRPRRRVSVTSRGLQPTRDIHAHLPALRGNGVRRGPNRELCRGPAAEYRLEVGTEMKSERDKLE